MGSVDTSLHKHTSGRAAKFAASHSSPHPLILYGGWFCPFVQRSWITLHEKRIPHQYFEINPYHKDPDFLKLNPRGLVPTLAVPVDDQGKEQKPLYESQVICEYLDEVYDDEAQHGRDLLPRGKEDAYLRAKCRIWIDHISTRIIPAFYRFMQHTEGKAYSLEEAREEFLGHIKTFVGALDAHGGPFFLGDRFSMVDVMLAPWLCRMFLFDVYKGGVGIPEPGQGGEDEAVWNRWRKWARAVGERESVLDTLSDREQYIDAYKRYAEDQTQSQVGQATRAGRGLP
jgi:glutathione S-transferase